MPSCFTDGLTPTYDQGFAIGVEDACAGTAADEAYKGWRSESDEEIQCLYLGYEEGYYRGENNPEYCD